MENKMIEEFCKYGINRVIFHRKNSLEDMAQIIANMERRNRSLEYEAFVVNEKCHITGAFCNSLHCDELAHIGELDDVELLAFALDVGVGRLPGLEVAAPDCSGKSGSAFRGRESAVRHHCLGESGKLP